MKDVMAPGGWVLPSRLVSRKSVTENIAGNGATRCTMIQLNEIRNKTSWSFFLQKWKK